MAAPTNTLGTNNSILIAQEALTQLKARLPFLAQIASNHSDERVKLNSTVKIKEVQYTAAQTFNPATGYVPGNKTMVDIDVTINQHAHHTYGVTVQDASSTSMDLVKNLGKLGAYALGAHIVNSLMALVTAANFTNYSAVSLGAGEDGYNRKGVLRVRKALSKRGVVPMDNFMLLNPDYQASLFSDDSLLNMLVLSGQKVIGGTEVPQVHGFGISEYVELPANGENLVGIAGARTALGFATRLPDDPGQGRPELQLSTVTDDQTGIALQVREYYDTTLAVFNRSLTLMYGVGKGQTDALQRILSQAPAA